MTRVLIVDDKEENVYYLQALLTGHGFEVETARHGAEALVKARQHPPELIVSDLLMPVMDGYTLLRHWKSDAALRLIPFIVYTATYTEEQDEKLAFSLGADAFILKPAEPEDFLTRIRTVQSAPAVAQPVTHFDSVGGEQDTLKIYSETLIRKLEEKTLQLEQSNQALQKDIAERTRMEESLRESEERFRATFEQAAVGIAHVGVDGRFLRVNDKLCEITGYPREELLRLTFIELTMHEDRVAGDQARLEMLGHARTDFSAEKRYLRKNGAVFWVSVVTTLLRDHQGAAKYFISVIADITERKTLEQQFLRAQRMESIGTLAGGIAHDLNNLLAPIMMGVELLRFNSIDPKTAKMIDNMERSAKRAASLVRQVLSFARGVDGQRVLIQVRHIINEVEAIIESTFPKNIRLESSLGADLWPVVSDPTQLNQVLLNLCVNARDAMPDGGCLTLKTSCATLDEQSAAMNPGATAGSYVLIEVADTGCGIPKNILDRIFDPFFTTKELGKGTGLGLSTVLGIVRSHEGFVTVHSEPGEGTTFRVYLPAQVEEEAEAPAQGAMDSAPSGEGQLVLVVDDESSIRDIMKHTLEAFGYRVITAEDGVQALGIYVLQSREVAVVITDMMMPAMDGPMLIAALRRINPSVRIIGVSGLNAQCSLSAGQDGGVKHFLNKPYTAETLLVLLKKVLAE
ncbi:ATP-binding response regulator [Rariglobus hedericola]|uniref:histidine kinase n=1 Tax=Rariglobus hedericola TaxID=2597822 RepID=A0A556QKA4_9BACT|nr:response regulator [Rariglobus hedericola]TSJ77083.1 response regulator [Rariglobus hedericola]